MVNTNALDEIKEKMINISSEMYTKGTISGLELIKEYVALDKDVTVESILNVCDLYINKFKQAT